MKSPSRPPVPLRDRNHRDMILKDHSYLIQKEISQRRQTRVQQARQRANEMARVVRQRTEREKVRLVSDFQSSYFNEMARCFQRSNDFNVTENENLPYVQLIALLHILDPQKDFIFHVPFVSNQ